MHPYATDSCACFNSSGVKTLSRSFSLSLSIERVSPSSSKSLNFTVSPERSKKCYFFVNPKLDLVKMKHI